MKIKKYNKKYFGHISSSSLKTIYRRYDGINIWFLLEQNHKNIGDLAIGVADKKLFEKLFPDISKHYVYEYLYSKNKKFFEQLIKEKDIIVLTGGGSIGNYESHEYLREDIVSRFKNNIIISMPQTMYFPDTQKGKDDYKKAVVIYKNNKNLLILAREKYTYEDMLKAFPYNDVRLTPDIVMTLDKTMPEMKREGITLCFRNDLEKNIKEEDIKKIENLCTKYESDVKRTDMTADIEFISLDERDKIVEEKINQFKRSKLVITDRLHCMIFCAISSTPCIALSNYNFKVKGCYDWIKNLNYIKYCDNIESIDNYISELLEINIEKYDSSFTKEYFKCISDFINK